MIQAYWLHRENHPLADEAAVGAVLGAIEAFPLATWGRYALNGPTSWRPWTLERAVIDGQTQRTQNMTIEADDGWRCLVTLGKFGERPAVLFQSVTAVLGEDDIERLEAFLRQVIADVPGVDRVTGVNAAAQQAADLSIIPTLETPGAFDWIGPGLLEKLGEPDLGTIPGTAEPLRGGVLLKIEPPVWTAGSRDGLTAMGRWWMAQVV